MNFVQDSNDARCPVCGHFAEDFPELEAHVNSHFETSRADPSEAGPSASNLREEGQSNGHVLEIQGEAATNGHRLGRTSDRRALPVCPICDRELDDFAELESHVDDHLLEDEETPRPRNKASTVDRNLGTKNSREKAANGGNMGRKPFIHPSWKDSLTSCTAGVVERIRAFHASNCRSRLHLCNNCSHFSTGGMPDSGYGCGYRNLQMMLSCLSENLTFQERVFQGQAFIPSVYRLQMLLEEAWREGFDEVGAEQLRRKVTKTRKWIGATEVATILSYLRVRCQIYDFASRAPGSVGHPRLEECVRSYFESENVWKSPLYFQHQGHSRTIIGFEERASGLHLLVLDPGMPKAELGQTLGGMGRGQLRFGDARLPDEISMPLSSFGSKQYQVVAVLGLMEGRQEIEVVLTF